MKPILTNLLTGHVLSLAQRFPGVMSSTTLPLIKRAREGEEEKYPTRFELIMESEESEPFLENLEIRVPAEMTPAYPWWRLGAASAGLGLGAYVGSKVFGGLLGSLSGGLIGMILAKPIFDAFFSQMPRTDYLRPTTSYYVKEHALGIGGFLLGLLVLLLGAHYAEGHLFESLQKSLQK